LLTLEFGPSKSALHRRGQDGRHEIGNDLIGGFGSVGFLSAIFCFRAGVVESSGGESQENSNAL